ncbi:flavin reductase family protein [Arthrobacter sp.]|uniref:flavin reductase family protein n=1 Tax=Arthrobacter sp. TaxID=1667 RepID=UPI003A8C90AA
MENPEPLPGHRIDPGAVDQEDIDAYRLLAGDIAAGTAVVATRHHGHDIAATVTGFLDVSYDPPTMLVSLYADGRIAEAVEAAGTWTLSLLTGGQEGTANWLASPGNPVHGLLNQVHFSRSPVSGSAVIDGAIAWFELRTTAVHPVATHLVVAGEVVAMGGTGDPHAENDPLVHFSREYRHLR